MACQTSEPLDSSPALELVGDAFATPAWRAKPPLSEATVLARLPPAKRLAKSLLLVDGGLRPAPWPPDPSLAGLAGENSPRAPLRGRPPLRKPLEAVDVGVSASKDGELEDPRNDRAAAKGPPLA
eukprot:CAMPEP_0117528768 /NCGR_PEP_ID=MMETSP0784-20121206/37487_1 /TAXON_ID=39447 /ORGANISM="" /LENGTH=124 /DNA_ID=CAMNT_0005325069 /DNA_START=163 /DNA_END=534 /DNA_ORIENTATION=-